MSTPDELDDYIPAEIDFSGGARGRFYRPSAVLRFVCPETGDAVVVNADMIAAGLSPFQPEAAAFRAGRVMLEEIAANAAAGRNFAFETTLAGLTYSTMIPKWRTAGY